MSGDSVGASGRRSSPPVASAGSSDGLAASVVPVSARHRRFALVQSSLGFVWFAYGQSNAAVARLSYALPLKPRALGCTWCHPCGLVSTRLVCSSTRSCARRSSSAGEYAWSTSMSPRPSRLLCAAGPELRAASSVTSVPHEMY